MSRKVNIHHKRFSDFLKYLKDNDAEITIHKKNTAPLTYSFDRDQPKIKSLLCEILNLSESKINEYFRTNLKKNNISSGREKIRYESSNFIFDIGAHFKNKDDVKDRDAFILGKIMSLDYLLKYYPKLTLGFFIYLSGLYHNLMTGNKKESLFKAYLDYDNRNEYDFYTDNVSTVNGNTYTISNDYYFQEHVYKPTEQTKGVNEKYKSILLNKKIYNLDIDLYNKFIIDNETTHHNKNYTDEFIVTHCSYLYHKFIKYYYDNTTYLINDKDTINTSYNNISNNLYYSLYIMNLTNFMYKNNYNFISLELSIFNILYLNLLGQIFLEHDLKNENIIFTICTSVEGKSIDYIKELTSIDTLSKELTEYYFDDDIENIFKSNSCHLIKFDLKKDRSNSDSFHIDKEEIKTEIFNTLKKSYTESLLKTFGYKD